MTKIGATQKRNKPKSNQEQTKARKKAKQLEGMKRKHTLELTQWIHNLGVGSLKVLQSFGTKVQWVNFVQTKSYLYHWKFLKVQISKLSLNFSFGTLNWELWPKETLGVKLAIITTNLTPNH
jgi:hypothetical protein